MISTKGRYALRVMIDLAEHQEGKTYIALKDIAERQMISKKYLEIIVKMLVNGKLLTGASGKGGGYRLTRKPEDYRVNEVLELTEGSLATVACLAKDAPPCPRAGYCRTLPMWEEYDRMERAYFSSITLDDLIFDHWEKKNVPPAHSRAEAQLQNQP